VLLANHFSQAGSSLLPVAKEELTSAANRLSYAANTGLLAGSVLQYWGNYFGSRQFGKDQEFYVVYTNIDNSIPFQSDSAGQYWLVNLKLVPTSVKLGNPSVCKTFADIRHAYVDMAKTACAAFKAVPTVMPHFARPGGTALSLTRSVLKPINCCPSLHTAAPFYAYNLGARYFPESEQELRECVAEVVSTVIKTKLHALIDIAFGLFLAQKAVNERLGLDFNDLESHFTGPQTARDKIPYDNVYAMYREIRDLSKTVGGGKNSLPDLMDRYFREIGLPRVTRKHSNCLYDLETKALVFPHELEVGRGLI
jgi:hypothetical protein